jgi:hypothetical protein
VIHELLERTFGFVIDFDFFGADPCFSHELLRGHEEVEEGARGW